MLVLNIIRGRLILRQTCMSYTDAEPWQLDRSPTIGGTVRGQRVLGKPKDAQVVSFKGKV